MKALILCLYIATIVAWPSGVYIIDDVNSQFYNPLTDPHSKLDFGIGSRGDKYRVAEKFVTKANICIALDE